MARAGDIIGGKYRLIHPLGIGGMGTVWRCEHTSLRLQMAIKLLDARGPAAERAVQRFQREARIAASIRHRNIVYISDFGAEGGAPYLVMELLDGVALAERFVVGEPLTVEAFLQILVESLEGLEAVHLAGVVHRDMKPENVFLVRDGARCLPKLLDFGVSRSAERGHGDTITRDGIVMGTPEYVSPEQARGKLADPRSDLYSLGVMMYEALAGRLPFQADNAADLIVAVLNAKPVPLVSLRPDLGARLSEIVHKAMARQPEERFQTAAEMRAAITSFLKDEPALAASRSLPKRRRAQLTSPVSPASVPPVSIHPSRLSPPSMRSKPPARFAAPPRRKALAIVVASTLATLGLVAFVVLSNGPARTGARAAAAVAPAGAADPGPLTVEVALFGIPPDATVLADGLPAVVPMRFARDSGSHVIEVRAPGMLPWRIAHDARNDGRYAIALEPSPASAPLEPSPEVTPSEEIPAEGSSRVHRKRSREARSSSAKSDSNKTQLLRQPDF